VAKRTRGSRSARRPGGQGPSRTKRASDAESSLEAPAETEFNSAEEIGATYAEVEVDEVAAAAVAASTSARPTEEQPVGRRSRQRVQGRSGKKAREDLTARAAAEDAWVRADLRRIGIVSAVLVAALAVAYVVFGVMDVLGLY
jgi:hypothetical protein